MGATGLPPGPGTRKPDPQTTPPRAAVGSEPSPRSETSVGAAGCSSGLWEAAASRTERRARTRVSTHAAGEDGDVLLGDVGEDFWDRCTAGARRRPSACVGQFLERYHQTRQ